MNNLANRSYSYRRLVSTVSQVIVPSGQDRDWLMVHNESGYLYLKLGPAAAMDDYTYRLNGNAVLELTTWVGPVSAVRASGSGWVMCTEIV